MRTLDNRAILDLGDTNNITISGSLSSLAISQTDENDTTYALFPTALNSPPIITSGIADASIPQIKPIQAVDRGEYRLYVNSDSTVRVISGQTIKFRVEAIQPNTLNVENGIPKIIPALSRLSYLWRKDGVEITNTPSSSLSQFIISGSELTLRNIDPTFTGLYSCDVINDISTTVSEDIDLEVIDIESDIYFLSNQITNPFLLNGTDGWTNVVGEVQAKQLSKQPTENFKIVNDIESFGYTTDMFYPRPYQLNFTDIKGFNTNNLVNGGGYLSRQKVNYYQNGETPIVSAYQDIDLTDIQEYIQNSIYGVKGVRAIFTCYIGNAVTRFLHSEYVASLERRRNKKSYWLSKPRLSVENWLVAGPPELSEQVEVIREEYDLDNRVRSQVLDLTTNGVQEQSSIILLDPWTKAIQSKFGQKVSPQSKGDRHDAIILANDQLFQSDSNKNTLGQYVEHNKVVIDKLNFNTTKIRIRINFSMYDPRLTELDEKFYDTSNELYDIVSFQKTWKTGTYEESADNFIANQMWPDETKAIQKKIPKSGVSRGLVTGLNLNLIPLIDNNRDNHYTKSIGQVMSNNISFVPNTLQPPQNPIAFRMFLNSIR